VTVEMKDVERATVLKTYPGDVIVLEVAGPMSRDTRSSIQTAAEEWFDGCRVVVLTSGIRLACVLSERDSNSHNVEAGDGNPTAE